MKNILIYYEIYCSRTGIETWISTFYKNFKDKYNISILAKNFTSSKVDETLPIIKWNENEKYNADILFIMHFNINVPSNINSIKKYFVLHGDPRHLKIPEENKTDNFFTVSSKCQQWLKEKYNLDSVCVENYIYPYKPKKVLNLISCSRINAIKGCFRMTTLSEVLYKNGISFNWINYAPMDAVQNFNLSQLKWKHILPHPSVSHEQLMDYIASADYFVQLSDHESYCYGVNESLYFGPPVIVTDIEIFSHVINGYNGYKLDLDMKKIPIDDIVNDIPKDFTFTQDLESIKDQWEEILK